MGAQTGQIEVCNTLLKMKADANATDVVSQNTFFLRYYFEKKCGTILWPSQNTFFLRYYFEKMWYNTLAYHSYHFRWLQYKSYFLI